MSVVFLQNLIYWYLLDLVLVCYHLNFSEAAGFFLCNCLNIVLIDLHLSLNHFLIVLHITLNHYLFLDFLVSFFLFLRQYHCFH